MKTYISKHASVFTTEGIVVLVLGLLAILMPTLFTIGIELLIGLFLLIGGVFAVARARRLRDMPGSRITMGSGILTALLGVLLVAFPMEGVLTLTLLLAAFFLLEGIAEITFAFRQQRDLLPRGWIIASGLASIVVAALLVIQWPDSADWAIGLLVGISLLFTGWWLIIFGLAIRRTATHMA